MASPFKGQSGLTANRPSKTSRGLSGYASLREKIRETLIESRGRIEREKILAYWKTGDCINRHIRLHSGRAEYGKKVLDRLSGDLGVAASVLKKTAQFAAAYPQTRSARSELTWAHYRSLMTVADLEVREALERKAIEQSWASRVLEGRIRQYHGRLRGRVSSTVRPAFLCAPVLGPFFTYRIVRPETLHSKANRPLIDLGFTVTLAASAFPATDIKPDSIITSRKDSAGRYSLVKAPKQAAASLFTYKAFVERVIDGDSLKVEIDLGFHIRLRQTLRLKAIDAPEMDTAEGRAAKAFVEAALKGTESIMVKTTRADKYDRYLADVFIPAPKGGIRYLNNELLTYGHAVKMHPKKKITHNQSLFIESVE